MSVESIPPWLQSLDAMLNLSASADARQHRTHEHSITFSNGNDPFGRLHRQDTDQSSMDLRDLSTASR